MLNRVLVADPPWPSKPMRIGPNPKKKEAGAKYPLMSVDDICKFPLPPLLNDSILFLWRLNSRLRTNESGIKASLRVCEAWGFEPYGELVWDKLTAKGNPWFGMGLLLHGSHEACLVGFRGNLNRLKPASAERTRFPAKYTGQHSGKPNEFYELVERMYPAGPYAELFARKERPRWTCYGNELTNAQPR